MGSGLAALVSGFGSISPGRRFLGSDEGSADGSLPYALSSSLSYCSMHWLAVLPPIIGAIVLH